MTQEMEERLDMAATDLGVAKHLKALITRSRWRSSDIIANSLRRRASKP